MIEGPLLTCRKAQGLELADLRRLTKISFARLEQIEAGRGKPITRPEAKLLGGALGIASENLLPMGFSGCSDLDVDEDEILARDE